VTVVTYALVPIASVISTATVAMWSKRIDAVTTRILVGAEGFEPPTAGV
jgi:hypothetical protein